MIGQEEIDTTDLFGCMFAGEEKVQQIEKKGIFIVGQSKHGKSTAFNYIIGNRLKGKKVNKSLTIYEAISNGKKAKISDSFKSVTLLPNIKKNISDHSRISLIDMAGFHDKERQYVGIFAVSYMLKIAFEKVMGSKIILVINHTTLSHDCQIDKLCEPFENLIGILNTGSDSWDKEKFFNSVAVLVTKAQREEDQYLYTISRMIKEISKKIIKRQENTPQKLLVDLLKSIHNYKRITIFKLAQAGKQPDTCNILKILQEKDKKWEYFNYNNLQRANIFQIPFKQQFKKMNNNDKTKYQDCIQKKIGFIRKSNTLMKQLIKISIENCQSQVFQNEFSESFKAMKQIIDPNPYKNFTSIENYLQNKYQVRVGEDLGTKKRLKLINQIESIDKLMKQLNSPQKKNERHTIIMDIYKKVRMIICKNQEENKIFTKFMFLNIRTFNQCVVIQQIQDSLGTSVIQQIQDGLQHIIQTPLSVIKGNFIIKFELKKNELNEFQKFTEKFVKEGIIQFQQNQGAKQSKKIQIKFAGIKLKKGKIFLSEQKFKISLEALIQANEYLNKIIQQNAQKLQEQHKDEISSVRKDIYLRIGENLEAVKKTQLALKVYKHIKAVSYFDEYIQKIIKQETNLQKKCNWMMQRAQFKQDTEKYEEASKIFQKITDNFPYQPRSFHQEVNKKIIQCYDRIQTKKALQYRQSRKKRYQVEDNPQIMEQLQKLLANFLDLTNNQQGMTS